MLTRRFLGLLLAFLLPGCVSLPPREGLELSLVNIRLGESTLWETTAYFTVRVGNGAPEPLLLDGGVHKFYLNGHYVGEGLTGERLEVPRFSSVTQDVLVHLSNVSMVARVRSILEARAVDYRVTSALYLLEQGRSARYKLERSGRLALDDFRPLAAPPVSPPVPR